MTSYTPGGYHQREGYQPPSSPRTMRSAWHYIPDSKRTWAFAATVLLQAAVCLALECYVFGLFEADLEVSSGCPVSRVIPTYLSLFIFGFLYQMILTYDALRLKNTIQIIGLCLYNVGLLIEAAVQLDQINDAIHIEELPDGWDSTCPTTGLISPGFENHVKPFVIAIPAIMGGFTILMAFEAWKLYEEFAWSIYKQISADLRLKHRFRDYQIYIALLKFDFFFFLAFTIMFLITVTETPTYEMVLTIAAIPITIILLFLAAFWVQDESVWGMIVTIIIFFAGLAYFIFKLTRMYYGPRVDDYLVGRHSLTTFAVLTFILLLVTIAYAVICALNFNKGLKRHIESTTTFKLGGKRRRANTTEIDKINGTTDMQPQQDPNAGRITIE